MLKAMSSSSIRVMSFNIRNTGAPDGDNHWIYRKDLWAKTVRQFNPDLLGVQEVLADQYEYLGEQFPDYRFVGVAREDGIREGEWALILYRADRFEQLDAGNFWLSETPEIVGSRSWDAACVRICSWVKLRDKQSGHQLLHANTHFDHQGMKAQHESARLVSEKLSKLAAKSAVILTGDFNCTEMDAPYTALVDAGSTGGIQLMDSYRTLHPDRTDQESSFHSFDGGHHGLRIDWILHTPDLIPLEAAIDHTCDASGRWPSDHYPVTTVFGWA
jgi:endonuclease/exonuclease/phosphatase family metal-dependent hydrolase